LLMSGAHDEGRPTSARCKGLSTRHVGRSSQKCPHRASVKPMRQALAQDLSPPEPGYRTSGGLYVSSSIHDDEPTPPYGVNMPDIPDGPGKALATLIRDARQAKGWRQEDLEIISGVSRQTIIQYESGRAVAPEPAKIRAVLLALDVDPREAPVALGYV